MPSGWFRELKGDRLEVRLTTDTHTLHMTGPEDHVREAVGHFETWAGIAIGATDYKDKRFGKAPAPMDGQLDLEVEIAREETSGAA